MEIFIAHIQYFLKNLQVKIYKIG